MELEYKANVAVAEVGKQFARQLSGVDAINANRTCIRFVQGADDLQ